MRIDYQGLAWHNLCRACPWELRSDLIRRDLWRDMRQEVLIAVIEADRSHLNFQEASRFVQRAIYSALRKMGYRKGRRWVGYLSEAQIPEERR